MNSTIVFNEACFYHHNLCIIYFLSKSNLNVGIKNIKYSNLEKLNLPTNHSLLDRILFKRYDRKSNIFMIILKGTFNNYNGKRITIIYSDNTVKKNIKLIFPFQKFISKLKKNSVIISTMCQNYNNRLTEWIKYNLKLGFDGIIIFNNGGVLKNDFINNNSDKILIVKFPYKPFENELWNTIQSISFCIGCYVSKLCSNYIALIDADEFIYIPGNNNIKNFLSNYNNKSIQFHSNLITNIANNDEYNNNVLKLCKYVGPNKYSKMIINTNDINFKSPFIHNPHVIQTRFIRLDKSIIIHYHAWINRRLLYTPNMKKINFLEDFLYK